MGRRIVYLKKSNRPGKKYMVYIDPPGKTVHFGASGMSDYTKHKDKKRMKRYATRHKKRESWGCSGITTAGFWSKRLLWNKPTIAGSKRDIASKCNVTFRSGWPKGKGGSKKKRVKSKRKSKKRKSTKKGKRSKKGKTKKSRKKSKKKSRKTKKRKGSARMGMRKRSTKRRSTKRRSSKKGSKYERCVMHVKARQNKSCARRKWKGKSCVNPWAVCTARVGRSR